jgi:hypothetical protein
MAVRSWSAKRARENPVAMEIVLAADEDSLAGHLDAGEIDTTNKGKASKLQKIIDRAHANGTRPIK